jgi:hypothetical protein
MKTWFGFSHVLPSAPTTQLSGQFAITGGQSPILFALIMLYNTVIMNPTNNIPATSNTIR